MKKILALVLSAFLLTGCVSKFNLQPNEVRTFCVDEGKHSFKPYDYVWYPYNVLSNQWFFTESMQYDLGDNDQKDRNKLWGISFHQFTNHKNSLMCDWNWDLEGQFWTVAPYYHLDGEVFHFPFAEDVDTLRIYPGEDFETHFNVQEMGVSGIASLTIIAPSGTLYFEKDFGIVIDHIRVIHPYFGGNEKAPHDMCLRTRLIDLE